MVVIANYDPFLFALGLISAIAWILPFRVPPRSHAGIREGDEKETVGHYLKESGTVYQAHDGFLGISFDEKGQKWCGGKLKCCRPFDHSAWYHVAAISAMGMNFLVHFLYYFHDYGPSSMQDTTNLVWVSWGCGLVGAFLCAFKGYFHDVGFALATWITTAIWLLKTINVDWPAAGELAFVSVAGVMAIAFLSICVFCGICGVCAITCCTCRCCHDEISHRATKLFLRFNMHACIAIAIVLGFNLSTKSISNYLENDRDWLLQLFYQALGVFVAGVAYRLLFWHKGSGWCGVCTCCSYCYEHFYDEKKHIWGDIADQEAFCCYCWPPDDNSKTAVQKKPPARPQRIAQQRPQVTLVSSSPMILTGVKTDIIRSAPNAPKHRIPRQDYKPRLPLRESSADESEARPLLMVEDVL